MTQQSAPPYTPGLADAGGQVARLRQVLGLVEEIGGLDASAGDDALDAAARISAAYEAALPIVQRRFDGLACQTARWAAAGVEALLILRERGRSGRAAAATLARELGKALAALAAIVSA